MRLGLLVPASLAEDTEDPRVRTYKVGTVGRAAAVVGVERVVVYDDMVSDASEGRFVSTVLRYQGTPPYLRKRLFPIQDELRYAGVLPPLNLPTHAVDRRPREGELREGVVLRGGRVDVGLGEPARLREDVPADERVLVEVEAVEGRDVFVRLAQDPPQGAAAFNVQRTGRLTEELGSFDVRVGTSKEGAPATELRSLMEDVAEHERDPEAAEVQVGLAFGPPGRGLHEIANAEGATPTEAFDAIVNTVPGQWTRSVRTEEAIWITMGLVNAIRGGV